MAWRQPSASAFRTGVRVVNSLTRQKDELFTQTGDNRLSWYMCGPTVYDYSHLGHARTYLSFDIIRRLLRDYFGYQVMLCMNITDIDDKIIMRSKELGVEFSQFARNWENEFMKDMEDLGVELPEVITRVSEYVPEIINYIQKIIDNGYAYESNGSVYFDTRAFSQNHTYGKLEPDSVQDLDKLADGEGQLTDVYSSEKRSPSDFALWKKSKPGEPSWSSTWGEGRPGWHIECSVMASDNLPCPIDIHSGGVDLRFPHHDNELAQSEAFYQCDQWINYFWHTGHLHIDGLKMSKSLKNFITIRNILGTYSARQIRLMFLMHRWDTLMSYSEDSLGEAAEKERQLNEFFHNVRIKIREATSVQKWSDEDRNFYQAFEQTKLNVHKYLSDNFGTDQALTEIFELIRNANGYILTDAKKPLLVNLQQYMSWILQCMGLSFTSSQGNESIVEPLLDTLCSFRSEIRGQAMSLRATEILQACDRIRDITLPELGVRLEDRKDNNSVWKLEDKEALRKERERKLKEEEKAREKKQKYLEQQAKKEEEMKLKAQVSPQEMFIGNPDYSQFDDNGLPTHDANGEPLPKSKAKRLKKEWDKQAALYKKYNGQGNQQQNIHFFCKFQEANMFQRFLSVYTYYLYKRPLLSRVGTITGIITLSDILSQFITQKCNPLTFVENYDITRTLRMSFYALTWAGPASYVVYGKLYPYLYPLKKVNSAEAGLGVQLYKFRSVLLRVITDISFVTPSYLVVIFGMTEFLRTWSIQSARENIQNKFWSTYAISARLWPPVQLINFSLVPAQYNALVPSLIGVFWNAYLSYRTNKQEQVEQVQSLMLYKQIVKGLVQSIKNVIRKST